MRPRRRRALSEPAPLRPPPAPTSPTRRARTYGAGHPPLRRGPDAGRGVHRAAAALARPPVDVACGDADGRGEARLSPRHPGGPGRVRARMVYGRFGAPPASAWVRLGRRTLQLTWVSHGWRVRADVSRPSRSDIGVYGFTQLRHPYFINGSRADGRLRSDVRAGLDAEHILDAASSCPAPLAASRRGRRAAPAIFLIDNAGQGSGSPTSTSAGAPRRPGFQYSSFAYVDLPEWRRLDSVHQQSMVVHELDARRHPADARRCAAQPARGHRDGRGGALPAPARRVDVARGALRLPYYHDAFPTLRVWERRETDWGLSSSTSARSASATWTAWP